MLLLAVLILTGCAISLIVTLRCTIWVTAECQNREWGTVIREWLGETMPVLVAIAMGWRQQPPPPGPPPAVDRHG
jgi:hypothetical protein